MDSIKIGKYIAYKRKQKGMTQQELADILMITNKAISKWETGSGIPDVSILKDLAKALDITVDELLEGEDNQGDRPQEEKTYQVLPVNRHMYKQLLQHFLYQKRVLLTIMIMCGSLFVSGGYALYAMKKYVGKHTDVIGLILLVLGIIIMFLPIVFNKIKIASFQKYDARYTFDQYGIIYKGVHEERKYFYQDIHIVVLSESFVALRVGRQLIFIDNNDYILIRKYIECTQEQIGSSHDRYQLWATIVLIVLSVQFMCIELGYQIVLKRFGFEYSYNALEGTFIVSILLFLVLAIVINKIKLNKKNIVVMTLLSMGIVIGTYMINDLLTINETIWSISPNLSSQLLLKHNQETGKIQDYHYTFLCFGKKTNEMSANKDADIETKWITGDCNLVSYRGTNNENKSYVATYGDRGNGISYYNVVGCMSGDWQTYNKSDKSYHVSVNNGFITVEDNDQKVAFSSNDIQQNGTIAITLKRDSNAQYIIVLNEDCTLNEDYLINKNGHITIISTTDKTPVELFCTTYKEDSKAQEKINNQEKEWAMHLIEKMQQIIKDDPTLKNYESEQSIFKINTDSTDYFEVSKEAYFTQLDLFKESRFKEEGQIQTISVKAGSIQDFYVELDIDLFIEDTSTGESENSGLIPSYRIMKTEGGYLVAKTGTLPGDIGLASLSNPLEKDVSQDKDYHYTK